MLANPKIGDKVVSIHDPEYFGTITRLKYVPQKGFSNPYWWIYINDSEVPCGTSSEHWKIKEVD
jgi:hypothetical protein